MNRVRFFWHARLGSLRPVARVGNGDKETLGAGGSLFGERRRVQLGRCIKTLIETLTIGTKHAVYYDGACDAKAEGGPSSPVGAGGARLPSVFCFLLGGAAPP